MAGLATARRLEPGPELSEQMTTTDDAVHDDPATPTPGTATDGRRTALVLAVTLAVLFAVLAGVLAVLLGTTGGDDEVEDLRETAGRFGEALVTYDYRDPEAHRDAV